MSPAWRWRMCPACRNVERSSDYALVGSYAYGWDGGQATRECPRCGHQAETSGFGIVRERHAPSYAGAGTANPWP